MRVGRTSVNNDVKHQLNDTEQPHNRAIDWKEVAIAMTLAQARSSEQGQMELRKHKTVTKGREECEPQSTKLGSQ